MTKNQEKFLNVLADQHEEVAVSPSQFAYKSVTQRVLKEDRFTLLPNNENQGVALATAEDIQLIAINPICGAKNDENVTAFRSFLVELDEGDISSQRSYIENELKMPFSSCVFSGNKSLHYIISLESPVPEQHLWRHLNQWLLNIVSKADQQTKNPSRSTRFPEHHRSDGKGLVQEVIAIKERVCNDDFWHWLSKFKDLRPIEKKLRRSKRVLYSNVMPRKLRWKLEEGVYENRNQTWFNYACWLANYGWDEEGIIEAFDPYFEEESDFKEKEWLECIRSAVKRVDRGAQW